MSQINIKPIGIIPTRIQQWEIIVEKDPATATKIMTKYTSNGWTLVSFTPMPDARLGAVFVMLFGMI